MSDYTCNCNTVHDGPVKAAREAMLPPETLGTLSTFFKVFGDETRIRIIWALDGRELCVCDLASVLGMTKSAVSHQLGTLRAARLVKHRREGKTVFYALDDGHVQNILESGLEHINE